MTTNGHIRVLIAEDHPMMRRSLRTIVQAFPNVQVVGEAVTGEDAVMSAASLQPNVILMDINIPVLDGIAATRLIKMRYPHIAVIGLTCHTAGDLPAKGMSNAGAFDVLPKEKALDLYEVMQRAIRGSELPFSGAPHAPPPPTGSSVER